MQTIFEDAAARYLLAPVESPTNKADARDVEARARALCRTGKTAVYKGRERVGDLVDLAVWPYEHGALPAQTAYAGLTLTKKAWQAHKAGELSMDDLRVSGEGRTRVPVRDLLGRVVGKAHHDPFYGDGDVQPSTPLLDPQDDAELDSYDDSGAGQPPYHEAIDLASAPDFNELDLSNGNDGLRAAYAIDKMPAAQAATLAVHPLAPPAVRRLAARRARRGR